MSDTRRWKPRAAWLVTLVAFSTLQLAHAQVTERAAFKHAATQHARSSLKYHAADHSASTDGRRLSAKEVEQQGFQQHTAKKYEAVRQARSRTKQRAQEYNATVSRRNLAASCSAHSTCNSDEYCDAWLTCDVCSNCAIFDDAFNGVCPSTCTTWSLQSGDSVTLTSNTCAASYNTCQATCAEGYSVSLSGVAYTLTPTASASSLPSNCVCYTLGPATPTGSAWSGQIPVGPGQSVSGTVTETSATTYTVDMPTISCTLTYTKVASTSGSTSRRTFTFAALVGSALALI